MESPRGVCLPLAETRLALDARYTDAVRIRVHRYAEHRSAVVRRAGWPVPEHYAEDLVHDAIADLWLGAQPWDPQRTHLVLRLCSIIRDRTSVEIGARRG